MLQSAVLVAVSCCECIVPDHSLLNLNITIKCFLKYLQYIVFCQKKIPFSISQNSLWKIIDFLVAPWLDNPNWSKYSLALNNLSVDTLLYIPRLYNAENISRNMCSTYTQLKHKETRNVIKGFKESSVSGSLDLQTMHCNQHSSTAAIILPSVLSKSVQYAIQQHRLKHENIVATVSPSTPRKYPTN